MSGLSGPQNETIGSDNIEKVAGTTGLVGYANTYISLQAMNGIFINGIGIDHGAPGELPFSNEADAKGYISGVTNGNFWISGQNGGAVIKSCDRSTPGPNGEGIGSIHIKSANGDINVYGLNFNNDTQGASNINTVGDSTITTNGNTTITTNGNTVSTTNGDTAATTWGNLATIVGGGVENVFMGNTVNFALGAQENINAVELLNLCLGAQQNINLVEFLNLCLGFQQNINIGGLYTLSPAADSKTAPLVSSNAGLHIPFSETKIGTTVGAKIVSAGTSIQSAGIHVFT